MCRLLSAVVSCPILAASLFFLLLALGGTAPAEAGISAPYLAENVEPLAEPHVPTAQIRPWELVDKTLLIRSGFDGQPTDRGGVWRTDGTPEGTVILPIPGYRYVNSVVARTADRTRLYYTARNLDNTSRGLYITDGTVAGSVQLVAGAITGAIYHPESDRLFFERFTEVPSAIGGFVDALWVTDGTVEGTRPVTAPGEPVARYQFLATAGQYVYFISPGTSDVLVHSRLFRTDGTAAGTLEVDPSARVNHNIAEALGDRLLFTQAGPGGEELLVTDGEPGSVTRLAGPYLPLVLPLTRSGDLVYWAGDGHTLVRTDGTPEGTRVLVEIPDLGGGNGRPIFRGLTAFGPGSSLIFSGYTEAAGQEPWITDGTVAGTRLLADICPGPCSSDPDILSGFATGAYFRAGEAATGRELYGTDGTSVERLSDLCPGPCTARFLEGGQRADALAFFADGDHGWEVYLAEGLEPPVRLSDFAREDAVGFSLSFFRSSLTETGFYFYALTETGPQYLRADGTPGGIFPLLTPIHGFVGRGSYPSGLSEFQSDLVFTAYERDVGLSLYRKSGDAPSQRLGVLETGIEPDLNTPGHRTLTTGDRVFALTHDGSPPFTLSRVSVFDGGVGVKSLVDGLILHDAWVAADKLFFIHRNPSPQLWVSDGTVAGTRPLFSELPSYTAAPFRGRLLFETGSGLTLTDGTNGGTNGGTDWGTDWGTDLWLDLPALGLSNVVHLVPHPEGVFFSARVEGVGDLRLYFSDGSPAGTRRVSPEPTRVSQVLGLLGDRVGYVLAEGPESLAFVDPSAADHDSLPVADLLPLGEPMGPSVAVVGDTMWIGAGDGRVIRTTGEPAGTRTYFLHPDLGPWQVFGIDGQVLLLGDGALYAADGPMRPRRLATFELLGDEVEAVGDRVYFPAEGAERAGLELWAADRNGETPTPDDELRAPGSVRAEGREGAVELRWTDRSDGETHFVVQARGWALDSAFEPVAEVPAGATSARVLRPVLPGNVEAEEPRPVLLRVRAEGADGVSPWSEVVAATPVADPDVCTGAATATLCLQDGRFAVETFWSDDRNEAQGLGTAAPFDFSDDSGAFWFFDRDNIELVVKVLDARTVNGRFWSFYGALSDVEYFVVIDDLATGTNVTYRNPPQEICGRADVNAFPRPPLEAGGSSFGPAGRPPAGPARPDGLDLGVSACVPDDETLCLSASDRYRVSVTWRDQRSGDTGVGHAIPGTEDSGYFWFFDQESVELVVKVLDARTVNGFHWVFYGALTDVEYTVTVTDTLTGAVKEYVNPPGNICGEADTRAF